MEKDLGELILDGGLESKGKLGKERRRRGVDKRKGRVEEGRGGRGGV